MEQGSADPGAPRLNCHDALHRHEPPLGLRPWSMYGCLSAMKCMTANRLHVSPAPCYAEDFARPIGITVVARYRDDQWSSARHRAECSARTPHMEPAPLLAPIVELLLQL